MTRVWLTRRALRELGEIDTYSTRRWGQRVAGRYLTGIQEALVRIERDPAILRGIAEYSRVLKFHRVRQHLLVCDVIAGDVYLLAVIHGSQDLPRRVAEIEPGFADEARFLHDRIADERGGR